MLQEVTGEKTDLMKQIRCGVLLSELHRGFKIFAQSQQLPPVPLC